MRNTFLIFLVHCCAVSFAQVKDAGMWFNATAEYNLDSYTSAEIAQEFRFNENWGELGTYFTDLGLSYRPGGKNFKISGHYRFTTSRRVDDFYSRRHRWYLDASYRLRAKPLDVVFRTRYQSQVSDINRSEDGKVPALQWRNKLSLRFMLEKKYSPFVSVELFTDLKEKVLDKVRYSFGVNYKVNDIHETGLFFLHQRELYANNVTFDYVLGINYAILLDKLLKPKTE